MVKDSWFMVHGSWLRVKVYARKENKSIYDESGRLQAQGDILGKSMLWAKELTKFKGRKLVEKK